MTPRWALRRILGFLLILAGAAVPAAEPAPVPPSSETPAQVVVSGRTSTPVDVKVVFVDQQIPKTYAGERLKNTPGFKWWVSQHYAFKTDYSDAKARFYLTLLELAYPHYVELFGREPPGSAETRMAVVYGSDRKQMEKAMASDLGYQWTFGGGGITLEGLRVAYQYPSGTLEYHQRYILIHECVHLFQMCLVGTCGTTPGWYTEGIADGLSSHVWEESARRLTVFVFDKAAIPNFLDEGLREFGKPPRTFQGFHDGQKGLGRGANMMAVQFFMTDPDRAQRFRLWRDEMLWPASGGGKAQENSARLLQELFGSWEKLNADFRAWLDRQHNTFHYVDWGWEQDGNTLWSYGYPQKGPFSRTDVNEPPGAKPASSPLRLDYPDVEIPAIAGPVQRGVPEPSVACVVGFRRNPGRGKAGLGLGVVDPPAPEGEKPGYLKVIVEAEKTLVLDGSDLDLEKKVVPLPEEVLAAMKADRHRLGLTIRIGKEALKVTARAGPADGLKELEAALNLSEKARARLLEKPLTVLSRDARHDVTPFLDEQRRPGPDLSVPAPPNRWRNPGDQPLYHLYQACRDLGEKAPAGLLAARGELLDVVDKDPAVQAKAVEALDGKLVSLIREIRQQAGAAPLADRAVADLLGLSFVVQVESGAKPGEVEIRAELTGPLSGGAEGTMSFAVEARGPTAPPPEKESVRLQAGGKVSVRRTWGLGEAGGPFAVKARAELLWRGERLALTATRAFQATLPCWWVCGAFDHPGGATADVAHPPEKELDLKKTYPGKGGREVGWKRAERDAKLSATEEFIPDLTRLCGKAENVAAYACVWLLAPRDMQATLKIGSDDGVVAWLNGEKVHAHLVARGCTPGEDSVSIRLKEGRNLLLLKITQGGGGWAFCAGLEDARGNPLREVTATLEGEGK